MEEEPHILNVENKISILSSKKVFRALEADDLLIFLYLSSNHLILRQKLRIEILFQLLEFGRFSLLILKFCSYSYSLDIYKTSVDVNTT